MYDKLASAKDRVTNFARKHRTAITVVATATPLIALQVRAANEMNAFLKEHDLYDKYYEMNEI